MNTLGDDLLITAAITGFAWGALIGPVGHRLCRYGRGRHIAARPSRATGPDADAWLAGMRPDQSLAGLRLSRDLRRWLPAPARKLP